MKIALHTVAWGRDFPVEKEFFRYLANIGYSGLEIFQPCSLLGDPAEFDQMLKESGLSIVGLSGGSIESRLDFAKQLSHKPAYLYAQDLENEDVAILGAINAGYTIAVHPFLHTHIDMLSRATAHRAAFIEKHKLSADAISILPDTAHAYLAKEDIITWLNQAEPNLVRAMHLKDWQPSHGVSKTTFSRGFCELGKGVVNSLEPILDSIGKLTEMGMQWVVIEQDFSYEPMRSALDSIQYVQQRMPHERLVYRSIPPHLPTPRKHQMSREISDFAAIVTGASTRGAIVLYQTLVGQWANNIGADIATLWEVQSQTDTVVLRATFQRRGMAHWQPRNKVLRLKDCLCGLALADQQERRFDILKKINGRQFAEPELNEQFGATHMLSVPIFNCWNPAQPELLINLFGDHRIYDPQPRESTAGYTLTSSHIAGFRRYTAAAVQYCWDDHREQVSNLVTWNSASAKKSAELFNEIAKLIKAQLDAQHVYCFIAKPGWDGTQLQQVVPERKPTDSISNLAYKENIELERIAIETAKQAFNGRNVVNNAGTMNGKQLPILAVPLYSNQHPVGEPIGAVCCVGKCRGSAGKEGPDSFTTTDEIIVDAAQAAMMPHYAQLIASEMRAITVAKVAHDMKFPISLIMGCADMMRVYNAKHGINCHKTYNPVSILRHATFLKRVMDRGAALNPDRTTVLNRKRTLLFEDVIRPAIEQISPLLEKEKLAPSSINTAMITRMPLMYVDQEHFTEVVYNIFSNAIKYRRPDVPFSIDIYHKPLVAGTLLVFEDRGIGVPAGMESHIFDQGVRASNAEAMKIEGEGFGLFIVRQLLRLHGADIELLPRDGKTTKFGINLPDSLQQP